MPIAVRPESIEMANRLEKTKLNFMEASKREMFDVVGTLTDYTS